MLKQSLDSFTRSADVPTTIQQQWYDYCIIILHHMTDIN